MKKLLLLLLITICHLSTNAKTFKFKAFSTAVFSTGHSTMTNENTNILVTLDLDKLKLVIYTVPESNIDIVKMEESYKDGVNTTHLKFTGVDEDGTKCNVELLLYGNSTTDDIGTLVVGYNNMNCCYRLKKDE